MKTTTPSAQYTRPKPTKILRNWCAMMSGIEKKLAKVMHLPKSERYQALTPQERVWLKAQEHKEVL